MNVTIYCLDNKNGIKQKLFPVILELAQAVCLPFVESGQDERIDTLSFSNTFHIHGSKNEYEYDDISIWVCLWHSLRDGSKVVITGRWQMEEKNVELYIGDNNQEDVKKFSFKAENMKKAALAITGYVSSVIEQSEKT